MTPISPVVVAPDPEQGLQGYNFHEIVLAKDQPEFTPLPAAIIHKMTVPVLTRWRFSPEDLACILDGGELVLQVVTGGGGFPPINLQIVAEDKDAVLAVV